MLNPSDSQILKELQYRAGKDLPGITQLEAERDRGRIQTCLVGGGEMEGRGRGDEGENKEKSILSQDKMLSIPNAGMAIKVKTRNQVPSEHPQKATNTKGRRA